MKQAILLVLLHLFMGVTYAQTAFKRLTLSVGKGSEIAIITGNASVDIQGYDGDYIVVEHAPARQKTTSLQDGLTEVALNNRGEEDSVITYTAVEKNNLFKINITSNWKHLSIKIPNTTSLFSIQSTTLMPEAELRIENLMCPFSVDVSMKTISITNVSGPFAVKSYSGKVILKNISWKPNVRWTSSPFPYVIRSKNSDIDIHFPDSLKADFSLRTVSGQIFSGLPITPDLKLNGGGIKILIETDNGNIFLRKSVN